MKRSSKVPFYKNNHELILKTLKTILYFSLLALSTFILQSCKPDDIGKTYGPYTLGEAREYLDFKPGSWWVYQNNKSGLFDTLILKNISISTRRFEGKNILIKDMVGFLIYSTTTKYEYSYYTLTPNPDAKPEILERVKFIDIIHGKSKPGDYHGEAIPFFFPFDSTRKASLGVGETNFIGTDSIFVIKGNEFKKIRKFQQTQDPCWDGWTVKYYWAKDVGLIRKENVNKQDIWDLINFHVEKL